MTEASAELVVEHEHGLHLRPAAEFVRVASRFKSDIRVSNLTRGLDRRASARSLLEVTTLGVDRGHIIRLTASGEDAQAALEALTRLIDSGFELA